MPRKADSRTGEAQLNAVEMAHLSALTARAEAADARRMAKQYELAAMVTSLEATVLKMQAAHTQQEAKARASLDDLRAAFDLAKDEHDKWTRGVAAKYGVSWADSAYNELTGQITPAPK